MLNSPFLIYSFVWSVTLILYELKLSKLYPNLGYELIIFILGTIFINLFLGVITLKEIKKNYFRKKIIKFNSKKVFIILIILYILDFCYGGSIPLINVLIDPKYSYMSFKGIPLFHGFLYSISLYFSIKSYYIYVKSKEREYLLIYVTALLFPILSYSRGFIILIFTSTLLILLFENKKYLKKAIILGVIILYLFGIAGNMRHHYSAFDTTMIKEIAIIDKAETIFDPFYWAYVYISSPLGNLQANITDRCFQYNLQDLLIFNLLPDFISKKIIVNPVSTKLMVSNLGVSTLYIKAYNNYGMKGIYIIFIIYTLFNIIYINLLKNTKNYQVGIVLLYLIQTFSIFSNMYTLPAIGISIFYVFIYKLKSLIKYRVQ